jgi:Lrp/AsnC family leucine-responsive transcriptional regulator
MAVAEDLQAYGVFAETRINGLPSVKEVYTSFVMREVKAAANPPLPE